MEFGVNYEFPWISSTFHFRPVLRSFPTELENLQRKKNIFRNRFLFYKEKSAILQAIVSICSDCSKNETPHFSLEGVLIVTRSHHLCNASSNLNFVEIKDAAVVVNCYYILT